MILPETVLQDVRYGARMLFRNAGVTAVAVFALALGIGLNTAVFVAYRAMVARPLDGRDPDRVVNLALVRRSGAADPLFSESDYEAYRDRIRSFSGVISQSPTRLALTGAGDMVSERNSVAGSLFGQLGLLPPGGSNVEFASTFIISENYFSVLEVAPLRGRSFESMRVSELMATPSVLISENYWQRRFAGDPAVLGKTIRLNGAAFNIIGITPHDFVGTSVFVPDFWLPLRLQALVHSDGRAECCRLFARLAPGASIGQAQAEMTPLADHLRTLHDPQSEAAEPSTALVWTGSPFPLPIGLYSGMKLAIALVMAAAAMVLAVAGANVGSLLLARARSRQNELGVRLSLGASRARIIRQLLTESSLLGLLAGAGAVPFTWALTHLLATRFAEAMPSGVGTVVFHVTPDFTVLVYVLAISLAAGVLFGLAPALEISRSAVVSAFKGSAGTSPVRSRRLQDVLVAAQVAVSLVLMIAGSMFIRSALHAIRMDTGYDAKHVVDLDLRFPDGSKYTAGRKLALIRELRARLAALPGVAQITSARPPADGAFRTAAASLTGERAQSILHYAHVQPNYFDALGISVFMGRGFETPSGEAEHSVVLSESAAKQLWPGQSAVGRRLRLGAVDERVRDRGPLIADGPAYDVIGVARDTRGIELDGIDSRQVYLALPEDRLAEQPVLLKTRSDPAQVIRAIEAVAASVDPNLVVSASTLEQMLRQTPPFIVSSLAAVVASTVGLLGLVLASMGIYATVSYIVVLRTREVGIRMAIGAQKRDILGLMLRESARPVLAGLLTGILLAVGTSYALRGLLYGLGIVDTISFAGVSLLFLTIALLAAYPPSRRAMRVDPMVALRYE